MTTGASKRVARALGALQAFIGIGGVAGGAILVADPTGGGMGMDARALAGSPFPDFLIPGLVLLAVNGLGSLVGALASFAGWRGAGLLGAALGAFLLAWIALQVAIIGLHHWLQPTYFALGALELGLGLWLRARTEEKP